MAAAIDIEPLHTHADYRAVERLQRDVWRLEEAEIVPDHVLITAQNNGGMVLGAFERLPEGRKRLVGFVFGFVGLTPDGALKHCSHMLGVAPGHQNQGIGYRLKLAQRTHVLDQGMELITWTFDPLESRNASVNFHKLAGTCRTYVRDLYGDMRDELNAGLPSDRLQVEWHITSHHVTERLQWGGVLTSTDSGSPLSPIGSPVAQSERDVTILNRFVPDRYPRPPRDLRPVEGERIAIQIPAHFQRIRSTDIDLARTWREHTRALFEAVFEAGYAVVDFCFEEGRGCYLLVKGRVLS